MPEPPTPLSWTAYVAIIVGVAVVTGMVVGYLGSVFRFGGWVSPLLVGGAIGAAMIVIMRMGKAPQPRR